MVKAHSFFFPGPSDSHTLHSPLVVLGAFVAIATQETHTYDTPPPPPVSGGGGERQDIWQEQSEPLKLSKDHQ